MGATHSNVLLKIFFIGFLVILLLVPMLFITGLISERESRQWEAESEIHQTWGGPQHLGGPILTLPYSREIVDDKGKSRFRREQLHVLPEDLIIRGNLEPQIRRRGLFDAVVYDARLTIQAQFQLPDLARFHIDPASLHWDEARLSFGVSDLRGLAESPKMTWDGQDLDLESSADDTHPFPRAIVARLDHRLVPDPSAPTTRDSFAVGLDLVLRGSGSLQALPLGRETRVNLESPWADPSFRGAFLPSSRTVGEDGFDANWSTPHFARSYPQAWAGVGVGPELHQALDASAFGVDLLMAVDFHQQVSRCTKYAVLFIGLTFAVFFLFELLQGLRIHPVQYGMVGFAMCLFYLLLLAISEHLGFGTAYLTAAVATVVLITTYSATVLRTRGRATVLGLSLTTLYGVLFVLVQLQTYALLVGSLVLFLVLAAAMYLTRDIDWYDVGRRPDEAFETV